MTLTRQQFRRTDINYAQKNAKLREIQARFDHEVAATAVVDRATVERIRREFSRQGDPAVPAAALEMTFWSGYETLITTKATDRGERTIAKCRTLHTILHELEGCYGHLSLPTTPLASTSVRSRPSSHGTSLSVSKNFVLTDQPRRDRIRDLFHLPAAPAHGSLTCEN